MKKFITASTQILILAFLFIHSFSQENYLKGDVEYISVEPEIDGKLDEEVSFLKQREFPLVFKYNNSTPVVHADYRIAYSTDFFYVYIEAESDNLVFRDRAYQNGDGFQLLIANPKPGDESTDEFYVLACSAVNDRKMEWSRRLFWYYNVDHLFKRTSKDTKLMFSEDSGKISFELLLPWKDVYPYHPWLSEDIGFNLCFVKAVGESDKVEYKVLNDELGAENSKRDYLRLKFDKPVHKGEPKTYFLPEKNNISGEEKVNGRAVTICSGDFQEDLIFKIISGENYVLDYLKQSYRCKPGINYSEFEINDKPVPPGGYKLEWYSEQNSSEGETWLTSMSDFDYESYMHQLIQMKDHLSNSSYHTLNMEIEEIATQLSEIKKYETCGEVRFRINELNNLMEQAKTGKDIIEEKKGFVRKAYRSKLDSTLQPYMVYIPENYSPGRAYPLVIYLHGSASDEKNIIGANYVIPDGFIALAPYGRGKSNCYSWENAQDDIVEAIDAVSESYSIDENRILLSGFSMGGYGVYRTFYETPGKYKALAIFSGHPDLANRWTGKDSYPDFLKDEYLKVFKNTPVFIFHGKEDLNCSFEKTLQLVEKLKLNGADVRFISEEDKGHSRANQSTIDEYYKWVSREMN